MTLADKEVNTKISKNKRLESIILTGEEIVILKPYARKARE